MRLDTTTWLEVRDYLDRSRGIIILTGSTEQHGPIGLIGTDTICAENVAVGVGQIADCLVAPTLAYTPAPFNLAFPGTVSIPAGLFEVLAREVVDSLRSQGFCRFYFLNGHGANLEPLNSVKRALAQSSAGPGSRICIRIRSWWAFPEVSSLRDRFYGEWEGMHATPSEVAITQAVGRRVTAKAAELPPERLSQAFVRAHAGDRHGPPDVHRARFPDGRVGSHSALATPEQGRELLNAAISAAAADYLQFIGDDKHGRPSES
ncbi:MAG: creatininase family protein [Paracoccaceae bacterium]|nr:creatininase family protein [Paracoccaceae bacterium]